MRTAIVMIAHGSRRAEANAELAELVRKVSEHSPAELVVPAYLELAEPTIPAAVKSCVDQGAQRVLMFPYFLSSGVHVSEDLERYRREFEDAFPDVQFTLTRPLGAHPGIPALVVDLLAERALDHRRAGDNDRVLRENDQSA